MAGKFKCISSDQDLKERVELPDRVVLTDNGAFDLEQKGMSGFYVWLGYQHDESGSSEISMKSVLQRTAYEVGKWMQGKYNTKYNIEDKWKDFEMFRVYVEKDNIDEAVDNYSLWIKFDKLIPHDMRFKEYHIVDGHILHWITQEYFDEFDLNHFYDVFEDFFTKYNSRVDTALVVPREETQWNYYKDFNKSKGAYMTIEDGPVMWNESFEIKKETLIPGTGIILEAGDKVKLVNKKTEAKNLSELKYLDPETIFEDSNFLFTVKRGIDANGAEVSRYYSVRTKPRSKADEYVIEIYIDFSWGTMTAESVQVKYGFSSNAMNQSISEFIRVLQDSMKFADKVASYLKVKVINK